MNKILLTKEERIALRDELNNYLTNKKIIITHKNGTETIHRRANFIKELNNNIQLKEKYELYIQQYRSEEEAIYCMIHLDDFENHRCRACSDTCCFSDDKRLYQKTCGKKECAQKLSRDNIDQMKNTKKMRYGKQGYNNREKAKRTCERLYNNPNYTNREKAKRTCLNEYGKEYYVQTDKFKEQAKETKIELYNNSNYNNRELARQTMVERYGAPYGMQIDEFKELWRTNYQKNNNPDNLVQNNDIIKFLNKFNNIYHQNIQIYGIYSNNKYFIKFIKRLYKNRKRKLKLREIANIFGFNISQTIKIRAQQLNLLGYFDIRDSELEIQFENFLIKNSIDGYDRKNHILKQENGYYKEIDFLICNIGFEINDIMTHNSTKKDRYYHINKTLQCKERNIRLIHLWEWELTNEDLWHSTSNWILNLLNLNKTEINVKDCTIKQVNIKEEKEFLNEHNLYDYIESDIALGLYHNNELLQIMTFKHQNNNNEFELLRFCTKYNYQVQFGAKEMLNYFIQKYNPIQIITTINLDKFTGKTFEELGFTLIEYKAPILIGNINSKYQSLYDCGQNIYQLKLN